MTKDEGWVKLEMAPIWNYKEEGTGATLEGVLTNIETDKGANHSNIYTFQKADGESLAVWGTTVLDGRLGSLTIGEEVKIRYLGLSKAGPGKKPYHNFEVYHKPGVVKKETPEEVENPENIEKLPF